MKHIILSIIFLLFANALADSNTRYEISNVHYSSDVLLYNQSSQEAVLKALSQFTGQYSPSETCNKRYFKELSFTQAYYEKNGISVLGIDYHMDEQDYPMETIMGDIHMNMTIITEVQNADIARIRKKGLYRIFGQFNLEKLHLTRQLDLLGEKTREDFVLNIDNSGNKSILMVISSAFPRDQVCLYKAN